MGRLNQILSRSKDSENAYRRRCPLPATRRRLPHPPSSGRNWPRVTTCWRAAPRHRSAHGSGVGLHRGLAILKQLAATSPTPEFARPWPGSTKIWQPAPRHQAAGGSGVGQAAALAIRKQLAADFPTDPSCAGPGDEPQLSWLVIPGHQAAGESGVGLPRRRHPPEAGCRRLPQPARVPSGIGKYTFNLVMCSAAPSGQRKRRRRMRRPWPSLNNSSPTSQPARVPPGVAREKDKSLNPLREREVFKKVVRSWKRR